MITAQNFFMLTGTTLGAIKVVSDVTGHKPGPLSGYQFTEAGGQHLDDTKKLISQKRGVTSDEYILTAAERANYFGEHDKWHGDNFLELETNTYTGSFKHRGTAKEFYVDAHILKTKATEASARSMNAYFKNEAEAELREIYKNNSSPSQNGDNASQRKENTARVDLSRPQLAGQGCHPPSQLELVQFPPISAGGHRLYAQPAQYSGSPDAMRPLTLGAHISAGKSAV